jgi:hypothetical protein
MAEQRHDGGDQIHESLIAVREFNTFDVAVPSKKTLQCNGRLTAALGHAQW